MSERTPWWKAFLVRKKPGTPKEVAPANALGEDFDPFATRPEKQKDAGGGASKAPGDQGKAETGKGTSLLSDETYDDSQLDSVFNEQTCRRNMRVSRSGRFKEKRRVRSGLPIEEKETDKTAAGKEEVR